MNKVLLSITAILLLCGFNSCKKETAVATCLPTQYIKYISWPDTTQLEYNAENKLSKIIDQNGYYSEISYFAGYIKKTFNTPGGITLSTYTYLLNAKGNIVHYTSDSGFYPDSAIYYYDDEDRKVLQLEYGHGSQAPRTYTSYHWNNGNVEIESRNTSNESKTTTYEYYTDKPYKGSAEILLESLYGKLNANPVKSSTYTDLNYSRKTDYYYNYNQSGYLTNQVYMWDNGISGTYAYTYDCN